MAFAPSHCVVNQDNAVICFQHCQSGSYIACFVIPSSCPVCGRSVGGSALKIPPFVLPSPFVNSSSSPYCVVIKPTVGTFLQYACIRVYS